MQKKLKVVHYINQFFAGVGGEEHNDYPLTMTDEPLGPGRLLQNLLGEQAEIILTLYCGDDYFVSNEDEVLGKIRNILLERKPDLVISGPAFDAGRYGVSLAWHLI